MQNLYPKTREENKIFRALLLQKAETSKSIRDDIIQRIKNDPLFFINVFCWTYDPRQQVNDLPFITYPYQDECILNIIKDIRDETDVAVEKSRDMGFSWMMVDIMTYGFFIGWPSLYGSYKEDYVDEKGNMDSHFERLRYTFERLPQWLLPDDLQMKYMGISSKSIGAEISGDAGDNFGTGGRRKFVVLDEFQVWQNDRKAFRKTKDITPCRIFGGTPEGKYNVYGKIMTKDKEYNHLQIKKYTLHWSLHPSKDQKWYDEQKLKRTKLDIAKELDISYEDSVTGAVYGEFASLATFDKYEFNPSFPLYTAWDFGRDMTAIIWVQIDPSTREHYIIDAFQKTDCDLDFFIPFITGKTSTVSSLSFTYTEEEKEIIELHSYWTTHYAHHYGDPYNGKSRNVLSTNTIQSTLAKYGIHIHFKHDSDLEDRITKTSLSFRKLHVDDRLTDFITAIIQSRYPEVTERSQATAEKTKPIHNIFSHYRTALEYYFDNQNDITPQKEILNYAKNSSIIQKEIKSDFEEAFSTKTGNLLRPIYKK